MGILTNDEQRTIDVWIEGIASEVAFWESRLIKRRRRFIEQNIKSKNPLDLKYIPEDKLDSILCRKSPTVLDVGCGMSYRNAPFYKDRQIDFHYIDPLASYYNEIIAKKKIKAPYVEFALVEYLSSFYSNSSVSLIILQNALDHSFDPVKGIVECVNVLRGSDEPDGGGTVH